DRPLPRDGVQQVLEHSAVDFAVLRFGRSTRPCREEHVRRRGAVHCSHDLVSVLEIGAKRRDLVVEFPRPATQTQNVPTVREQSLRDVAAADPRHADDERAPAHSVPRRPLTTQSARAVSSPSLLSRCGVDDGNARESPRLRTKSSTPTTTRNSPLRTCTNSWPLCRTRLSPRLDASPGS